MSTASLNEVRLIGNLGGDVEFRTVGDGIPCASFSMATTYRRGEDEHTEWHRIVLWKGLAERAQKYLRKGSSVFVGGHLRTRQWEDKEGIVRYTTEVVGGAMQMLGTKKAEDGAGGVDDEGPGREGASTGRPTQARKASANPVPPPAGPAFEEDDIPF